jgi:hypothetical protein
VGNSQIDIQSPTDIMTPEEVALFLRKSPSWVYKHWRELGGRKLGGSLFFPTKEDLYELLFRQGKGVESGLHPHGDQVHADLVQIKERCKKGSRKSQGGGKEPEATEPYGSDPNRHALLGAGEQEA